MNTGVSNIKLCERTFARGQQRWCVNHLGQWSTYMWGWWPNGGSYPSGRYMPVITKNVPQEILDSAKENNE